jgi:multiple sugar transport system substrate-binding protein
MLEFSRAVARQHPDMAQMGTAWMSGFPDALDTTPTGVDTGGFSAGPGQGHRGEWHHDRGPWYIDTNGLLYRKDLGRQGLALRPAPKT